MLTNLTNMSSLHGLWIIMHKLTHIFHKNPYFHNPLHLWFSSSLIYRREERNELMPYVRNESPMTQKVIDATKRIKDMSKDVASTMYQCLFTDTQLL
ncbi:hypothetical protein Mapa_016600 [Marchantia paleacea]|nr:hypothetical protein Mapa_016600 [Marchantia paleacea]